MRKITWLIVGIAIAVYAVHGLMVDDFVMPYDWRIGGSAKHTRFLHLCGMWGIGGSGCLLLVAEPFRNLAAGLIAVGGLFFLAVTTFTQSFIR